MKRTQLRKISERQKKKNIEKTAHSFILHKWMLEKWDEREIDGYCICFETGKKLKREFYRGNSCCYHHPLEKNMFPEYDMENWNLLILHPDVHSQAHSDLDKTPKVKKYTEEMKNLWL